MCSVSCVNSLKVQGGGDCPETSPDLGHSVALCSLISGQHRRTGASCPHLDVGAGKLTWKKKKEV